MKIYYIADFFLPSNKAYSIHVFKMLDAFGKIGCKSELLIPYFPGINPIKKIIKLYDLSSKKQIFISKIFNKKVNLNFLNRFFFGLQVSKKLYIKNNNQLVISRSLSSSFFLSLFKIKHYLEIHQELKGLTKFIFINLNFINSKYIIKNVFISKGLSNFYKNKTKNYIILHDGVDVDKFKFNKNIKKINKITYTGSLYKGRGIEKIINIAKKLPEKNFYIFGKRSERFKNVPRNVKIKSFVPHYNVPKILNFSDLLLLPYSKKVSINSKNFDDDIAKFTSPIKLFEYLASGTPIISSNLKVLREILKNNYNAILINKFENINVWVSVIKNLSKRKKFLKKISINAKKTALNYTWVKRANVYLNFHKKYLNI
tara:strand:- start:281 stop:1393 length:1113 start_codon:yes stop_codon:yes gene_type:complete